MLYTELTKRAMEICYITQKEQLDKGGMPYVFHPFHVAEQMETEEEVCAALLHDVVEDTPWTLKDLEAAGFPPAVTDALKLLTHEHGTSYLEYVKRLSGNRIASRVKLADLRHNSTGGRLQPLTEEEKERTKNRLQKYLKAQAILTGGEYDLGEMSLTLQCRLPFFLQVVLAPDGTVRRYVTETAAEGKQVFEDLTALLTWLEEHGYPVAETVSAVQLIGKQAVPGGQ